MLLDDFQYHLTLSPLIRESIASKERIAIVKETHPSQAQLDEVKNEFNEYLVYKVFEEDTVDGDHDAVCSMAAVTRLRHTPELAALDIVGLSVGKFKIPLTGSRTVTRVAKELGESVIELTHRQGNLLFIVHLAGGCPLALFVADIPELDPGFVQRNPTQRGGLAVQLGSPVWFTPNDIKRQAELMGFTSLG